MPNPWQGGSFCYNQPLRLRHLATNQYLAMRDDAVDIDVAAAEDAAGRVSDMLVRASDTDVRLVLPH